MICATAAVTVAVRTNEALASGLPLVVVVAVAGTVQSAGVQVRVICGGYASFVGDNVVCPLVYGIEKEKLL